MNFKLTNQPNYQIVFNKVQLAVLVFKSSHDPVVVMKFEFCAHSARLLRKPDHVLLWILSTDTGFCQCSICAE